MSYEDDRGQSISKGGMTDRHAYMKPQVVDLERRENSIRRLPQVHHSSHRATNIAL